MNGSMILKVSVTSLVLYKILSKLSEVYTSVRRFGLITLIKVFFLHLALRIPKYSAQFKEHDEFIKQSIRKDMLKLREDPTTELPEEGLPASLVLDRTNKWGKRDQQFQQKVSGAVYHGGEEFLEFLSECMRPYMLSNTIHIESFPSVRQMESEIVSMTLDLFNAPEGACGVLTCGGTESILLSMLAYREWGTQQGISKPEILVPITVHAAFGKAAHYFNMTLVSVEVGPNQLVDLRAFEREINRNTVVIVGSAPCYSSGVIDQLSEFSKLAIKHKTNFHVDSCLGGFITAFAEEAGFKIPICDFRIEGVTSISCDAHKYGYTPKGISIVLYRNEELRRFQYFSSPDWTGGAYAIASLGGSKTGANSAGAWGAMLSMGKEGYIDCTKKIMTAAAFIRNSIMMMEDLEVLGSPILSVVAFRGIEINAHAIGGEMKKNDGWELNCIQNPNGVHIAVTFANYPYAENFVDSLKRAVETIKNCEDVSKYSNVALYGLNTQIPDSNVVGDLLYHFLDCLYLA